MRTQVAPPPALKVTPIPEPVAKAPPLTEVSPETTAAPAAAERPDRRKTGIDRRAGLERRKMTAAESGYTGPERRVNTERRDTTGLERRRGPGRRRSDERRVAEEGEMNVNQFEFVMAVEAYKKVNKRLYPTWTEILEVLTQLGYRKVKNRTITLDVPEPKLFDGKDESVDVVDADDAEENWDELDD
jgi:hypothetical protein